MTRMTGPECAVMCNLINIHTYIHTYYGPQQNTLFNNRRLWYRKITCGDLPHHRQQQPSTRYHSLKALALGFLHQLRVRLDIIHAERLPKNKQTPTIRERKGELDLLQLVGKKTGQQSTTPPPQKTGQSITQGGTKNICWSYTTVPDFQPPLFFKIYKLRGTLYFIYSSLEKERRLFFFF